MNESALDTRHNCNLKLRIGYSLRISIFLAVENAKSSEGFN